MAIEPGDSGVNLGFGVVQSVDGIKASGMCPKSRKRKGPRSDLILVISTLVFTIVSPSSHSLSLILHKRNYLFL